MRPAPGGVFFDLDGTLIDTAPDFHRVLNRLRAEEGLPSVPFATVRTAVADGSRGLIARCFELPPEDPLFEALRQRLLDLYLQGVAEESRLFPGLEPLLNRLEACGIPWGIVTNKPRRFSEPLLAALGLSSRLSALVCADDLPVTKPHPDPVLKAARDTGIEPATGWYVGDHRRDIEAGRAAGMTTVAAHWGYLDPAESVLDWHADHVAHHGDELRHLLFAEP